MGWLRRRTPGRHRTAPAPATASPPAARPRVVLGFRDGSELSLDPGLPLTQALVHVAAQIGAA